MSVPLLAGRKITITGTASGIGFAGASLFMTLGARVFLTDKNETALFSTLAVARAASGCKAEVTPMP